MVKKEKAIGLLRNFAYKSLDASAERTIEALNALIASGSLAGRRDAISGVEKIVNDLENELLAARHVYHELPEELAGDRECEVIPLSTRKPSKGRSKL